MLTLCRSDNNVDQLMEMAKIAEAAERYDDMVQYISKALSNPRPGAKYVTLNDRERNLFSVAYKSIISSKRNSLRLLLSINNKSVIAGNSGLIDELNSFASSIEDELKTSCLAAIAICDRILENPELLLEHRVYYLKMEGDYYRYLAEFAHDDMKKELAEKSEQKYQEAVNDAVACGMSEASPVYLGLVLNFSVFYYEVKGDSEKVVKYLISDR